MDEPTVAPQTLAAALALLQTRLPEIKKSETAEVVTQKGTYSYTYANLAGISQQILPLLGELGLAFICKPTFSGDRFVLAYSLLHTGGEREDGEYPLPASGTPQAVGSAITYGRRYCLCAVTGVAPEEDDDASAAEAQAAASRGTAQRASGARRPPAAPPTSGRGTTQRARTPGRPPLPGEPERDGITGPQRGKILAILADLGIENRDERLRLSSAVVNRQLGSANELTKQEARVLIDTLESAKAEPDPQAWLAEVYGSLPVDDEAPGSGGGLKP